MPETLTAEQHRAYGLHSNIPPCCVEAWIAANEGNSAGHVWGVTQGKCVAHPDCTYRPQAIRMTDRGLPDIECEYVPCFDCHAKIAAGTLRPNVLHVCDRNADACKPFHPAPPTPDNP